MSTDKPQITHLDTRSPDFDAQLKAMLNRAMIGNPETNRTVENILSDVRLRGDAAVLEYTRRFDRFEADSIAELTVSKAQMEISLQDGSTRLFGPGQHFYSADVVPEGQAFDATLHGHWSRQVGADPLVTLFVRG